MDGASLIEALTEMKSMLNSPLKAFNCQSESDSSIAENDITSQFTRTMGKGMLRGFTIFFRLEVLSRM